jgi:CBS domain-containing protein
MSPRAAWRLETLGFATVFDYTAGKAEWLAYGLPSEGERADRPRAVHFARQDVATCALDEPVSAVRERLAVSPYGFALVLSEMRVLLGRLRRSALDATPNAIAGEVMESGPSTIRPDADAVELAARLTQRELTTAIVTTPDGRLVGVVRRDELPV